MQSEQLEDILVYPNPNNENQPLVRIAKTYPDYDYIVKNRLNRIAEITFDGSGCAISQASADLLLESIIGKTVEEVKVLGKQDVLDLLGIELGPVRLKCALLSLKVLKAGVYGLGEASDALVEG